MPPVEAVVSTAPADNTSANTFSTNTATTHQTRPTVDERHGNEDNAVEVDTETGVLRKTPRPGMGTIMAKERVGKTDRQTDHQTDRNTQQGRANEQEGRQTATPHPLLVQPVSL